MFPRPRCPLHQHLRQHMYDDNSIRTAHASAERSRGCLSKRAPLAPWTSVGGRGERGGGRTFSVGDQHCESFEHRDDKSKATTLLKHPRPVSFWNRKTEPW